jgi:penicillin amidase
MAVDSQAALVFSAWYRELTRLVYADELGDLFQDSWEQRGAFMIAVMKGERGSGRWCDDVRTKAVEDCQAMAGRAFDLAAAELRKRYGPPAEWRWGRAHTAASDHRPFGFIPVVKGLFSISPETPGRQLHRESRPLLVRDAERPFANRHARACARSTTSPTSSARSSCSPRDSRATSFAVVLELRRALGAVEYITIPTKRESIAAAHTLVLKP